MTDLLQNQPSPISNKSLIKTIFPTTATPVFYAAIVVGFLLIVTSLLLPHFISNTHSTSHGTIMLSVGLALICSAFGAQAAVNVGRWVVAGSAAIGMLLFWVVENNAERKIVLLTEKVEKSYIRGTIKTANSETFREAEMIGGVDFMGHYNKRNKFFQFAIFDKIKDYEFITFYVELPKGVDGDFSIHSSCLRQTIAGKARYLDWTIKSYSVPDGVGEIVLPAIYDNKEDVIISVYKHKEFAQKCTKYGVSPNPTPVMTSLFGITSAIAQPLNEPLFPSQQDLSKALSNLTSENKFKRRSARSVLSLAGPKFVPTIMSRMKSVAPSDPYNYRIVLGGNVALTLMLRRKRSLAHDLRKVLSEDDLKFLLSTAGHKDRTMRTYATEFLYDLNDKRVPQIALPLANDTTNSFARYNWIRSSQGSWTKLDQLKKDKLKPTIDGIFSKTDGATKTLLRSYITP